MIRCSILEVCTSFWWKRFIHFKYPYFGSSSYCRLRRKNAPILAFPVEFFMTRNPIWQKGNECVRFGFCWHFSTIYIRRYSLQILQTEVFFRWIVADLKFRTFAWVIKKLKLELNYRSLTSSSWTTKKVAASAKRKNLTKKSEMALEQLQVFMNDGLIKNIILIKNK